MNVRLQDDEKDMDWLRDECQRLEAYVTMLIELASSRAWSQSFFVNCAPNNFVGILHEDRTIAKQLLEFQKRVWDAVLHAEQLVKHPQKIKKDVQLELKARLADVCWNQMQLAREIHVECCRSQWNSEDTSLRDAARDLHGGPCNTKLDLEDCFAHLSSVGKTSSKSTPMNKSLR